MSADEMDRLGDKLRDRERGDEERYFAEREREALRKLRPGGQPVAVEARCPRCGDALREVVHQGVPVKECPSGHGLWLGEAELAEIGKRERDSWLGRLFHTPRPRV